MSPNAPPLIHHTASPAATSGWRAAVSIDTRAPPDRPMITAGAMSSCGEQRGEGVGLHRRLRRRR